MNDWLTTNRITLTLLAVLAALAGSFFLLREDSSARRPLPDPVATGQNIIGEQSKTMTGKMQLGGTPLEESTSASTNVEMDFEVEITANDQKGQPSVACLIDFAKFDEAGGRWIYSGGQGVHAKRKGRVFRFAGRIKVTVHQNRCRRVV